MKRFKGIFCILLAALCAVFLAACGDDGRLPYAKTMEKAAKLHTEAARLIRE